MPDETELSLPGNSSAKIEILQDPVLGTVVKKTCNGKAGVRLLVQAEKQERFESTEFLKSPHIFCKNTEPDQVTLLMEYAKGNDFVLFTSAASHQEFKTSVMILIDMIKKEFLHGELVDFPKNVWVQKVNEVISKCEERRIIDSQLTEKLKTVLLSGLPDKLKMGQCHGDFTFSNVIVEKPNRLHIFDFLDPPIETPYEDAAKFLQDAQFFWSLQKHKGQLDRTRVMICWSFAEKLFREEMSGICDFEMLRKFQVLGLLRVIPYTNDEKLIHFLTSCISREVSHDSDTSLRR